jgi:hypothetical protein
MKKLLLLAAVLLIASPAYGQTTDYIPYVTGSGPTYGNSVMYQSASSIGVGTTSPVAGGGGDNSAFRSVFRYTLVVNHHRPGGYGVDGIDRGERY